MTTIQFDLGQGTSVRLPAETAVKQLLDQLQSNVAQAMSKRYKIGERVPGQGGIFAGDILGDDGVIYGLIVVDEEDVGRVKWGPEGELDLSDWDGLSNTNRLRSESPAAKLASDYEADGHVDFYLPARRELLIAAANLPHLFGKDSYYWTSTPYGSTRAWVVGFEYGNVGIRYRNREFRVRPFRRFIY